MLRDVTTRNQIAHELNERERQYRLLADHAGDVVLQQRDGIIEWIAPSVSPLLGWWPGELVGNALSAIVHPDDQEALLTAPRTRPQAGSARRVRVRMQRRDGSWLWVETSYRALPGTDPSSRGRTMVCTLWNVQAEVEALHALEQAEADRRELEARMEQAARMEGLGVLAGGVAHDFNNLLVAILGNTELLLNDVDPDHQDHPLLMDVQHAAERAAGLTRQLLAYARQGPMATEPVDLSSLVLTTLPLVRSMVSESAVLHIDTPSGLPRVEGDPTQLEQVIMNLVINAAEALVERQGQVTVRVGMAQLSEDELRSISSAHLRSAGVYVSLTVTDTGHGMSEATVAQMYQPFFTTRFPGRGLGLAAVHGIVTAHGGLIETTSTAGVGTTVAVHLPVMRT